MVHTQYLTHTLKYWYNIKISKSSKFKSSHFLDASLYWETRLCMQPCTTVHYWWVTDTVTNWWLVLIRPCDLCPLTAIGIAGTVQGWRARYGSGMVCCNGNMNKEANSHCGWGSWHCFYQICGLQFCLYSYKIILVPWGGQLLSYAITLFSCRGKLWRDDFPGRSLSEFIILRMAFDQNDIFEMINSQINWRKLQCWLLCVKPSADTVITMLGSLI